MVRTILLTLACLPLLAIESTRIWDTAPHSAFTDIIRHKGRWICTFREGRGHVSSDGSIRVISSKDGKKWESLAELKQPNLDLRDPKITHTPSGELMLTAAADLNQADLFKITVQAVSLCIDGYAVAGCELGNEISEGFLFGDQGSARNFSGGTRSPAWRALGSRT